MSTGNACGQVEAAKDWRTDFTTLTYGSPIELKAATVGYLSECVPAHAERFDDLLREMCPAHEFLVRDVTAH